MLRESCSIVRKIMRWSLTRQIYLPRRQRTYRTGNEHEEASLWALTGLAGEAHGADPSGEALAAVAVAEKVAPLAALRSLRW